MREEHTHRRGDVFVCLLPIERGRGGGVREYFAYQTGRKEAYTRIFDDGGIMLGRRGSCDHGNTALVSSRRCLGAGKTRNNPFGFKNEIETSIVYSYGWDDEPRKCACWQRSRGARFCCDCCLLVYSTVVVASGHATSWRVQYGHSALPRTTSCGLDLLVTKRTDVNNELCTVLLTVVLSPLLWD